MKVDSNNPVVQLCAQGIELEMKGKIQEAKTCYEEAWEKTTNNYESCIAAHYMARVQDSVQNTWHWNNEAVRFADLVTKEKLDTFYPSLYLNLGRSYEDIGNISQARKYYQLAADRINTLPADALGNLTRQGIANGLERVSGQ